MPPLPELSDELRKARNSVFQQLKVRLRSEHEIRDKLTQREFSEEAIEQTIRYFKNLDFIDDTKFAKAWIQSRLKKPFGIRRIRLELKRKGIKEEISELAFQDALKDFSENDAALALAKKRKTKYKGIDDAKIKRRLFEYLARRGFASEAIFYALKKLKNDS